MQEIEQILMWAAWNNFSRRNVGRSLSMHPQNEIISCNKRVRKNNPETELLEVSISALLPNNSD